MMKKSIKSLLLAISWVLLSASTFMTIIFTQSDPHIFAQEPAVIINTTKKTDSEKIPSTPTESPQPISDSPVRDNKQPEGSTNEKKPGKVTEDNPSPEEIARQQKLIEAAQL